MSDESNAGQHGSSTGETKRGEHRRSARGGGQVRNRTDQSDLARQREIQLEKESARTGADPSAQARETKPKNRRTDGER